MLFYVRRLRQQGRIIPRHHLAKTSGPYGEFQLAEQKDRETLRTIRVAKLVDYYRPGQEVIPCLLDATLIFAGPDSWTLTGWEREVEGLTERAYQQSWWMVPLSPSEVRDVMSERIAVALQHGG